MSASTERKAERKAAAIAWQKAWQEDHSGSNPRANAFTSRNDDQGKKIPKHGRRGKGRVSSSSRPTYRAVKTSAVFASNLVMGASVVSFWKKVEAVVGQNAANQPGALPMVLDTNVAINGLFGTNKRGASEKLMELVLKTEEVAPLITWSIIDEYQRVFLVRGDPRLIRLCSLLSRSRLIPPLPVGEILDVEADDSDTQFIRALAQSLRGLATDERPQTRLVTWDKHLLEMNHDKDLPKPLRGLIVTPAEILRQLPRK